MRARSGWDLVGARYLGEPHRPGPFAGRGPLRYLRSDVRIADEVCELLTRDPWVDATELEVSVEDGEVTLRGAIGDRAQKKRAVALAEEVSGVHDVHDRMRIVPGLEHHGNAIGEVRVVSVSHDADPSELAEAYRAR
jgi:hypothetical protein